MPYIKEEDRIKLDQYITKNLGPINAGQLNYIFTKIILEYIKTKNQSYQTYNDIIGALECSKLELYRRFKENDTMKYIIPDTLHRCMGSECWCQEGQNI